MGKSKSKSGGGARNYKIGRAAGRETAKIFLKKKNKKF
jgi:hypothetical protein